MLCRVKIGGVLRLYIKMKKNTLPIAVGSVFLLVLLIWWSDPETDPLRSGKIVVKHQPLFDQQVPTPGPRSRKPAEVSESTPSPAKRLRPVAFADMTPRRPFIPKKGVFDSGRRQYAFQPDVWAVPQKDYEQGMGPEVGRNSHYVFFESESPPREALRAVAELPGGALGVYTGRLKMGYRPGSLDGLIRDFSLEPARIFENLASGYFTLSASEFSEALKIVDRLKKDPRVTLSELEIIESFAGAY